MSFPWSYSVLGLVPGYVGNSVDNPTYSPDPVVAGADYL